MPDQQTDPAGEPQITDEDRLAVKKLFIKMMQAEHPEIPDDVEIFRREFMSPTGNLRIDFEPGNGFIEWAIIASNRVIKDTLMEATDVLILDGKLTSDVKEDPRLIVQFESNPHMVAAYFGYMTMMRLIEKVKSAIHELPRDTEKIMEHIIFRAMKQTGFTDITGYKPNINDRVRAYARELAEDRRKGLLRDIKAFSKEPRFEYLPKIYQDILKIWQSVRKIYNANSESETWRDMVRAKYPDVEFPDDLLDRITNNPKLLSEELRAKLAETDGDHTPSTIAAEDAARICGASPYQFGVRHYHQLAAKKIEPTETE